MILRNLQIRCINLEGSLDRWKHVKNTFGDVKRIPAVDGLQWASGDFDQVGRPLWGANPGNAHFGVTAGFVLFPTTYGCNLSHLKAMRDFLASGEEWTIIIEDDTEPVGDLTAIEVPDDTDWFYLIGSSHPGGRLYIWPDNTVFLPRTLAAYALSRKAAKLAIQAMEPKHYFQTDWQIPARCFNSMRQSPFKTPNWPELPNRINAYGQRESIIQHSPLAARSTFTKDGLKPWIPKGLTMENLER